MKVGVYIDVSDIYHKLNRKFNGGKLDYSLLLTEISMYHGSVFRAFAYGVQHESEASGFIACLRAEGFEPCFKRPRIIKVGDRAIKQCHCGVGLTVDVVRFIDKVGTVLIGSSNPDFIPLVKWVRDQGKRVVIFASCIPRSLREAANTAVEISEDFLEER